MNIINKTRHSFYLSMSNGDIININTHAPDACKVIYKHRLLRTVNGIDVNEKEVIDVINLPPIVKNTIYIVSLEVIAALDKLAQSSSKYERSDVFALDIDTCESNCYNTSFIATNYFSQMTFYFSSI